FGGLPNGPSAIRPALAWFNDLGNGIAVQGFVSQNITTGQGHILSHATQSLSYYGFSVQCPLPEVKHLFLYGEALGSVIVDDGDVESRPAFLLGVQYHLDADCWLSLAATARHGLISCVWKF